MIVAAGGCLAARYVVLGNGHQLESAEIGWDARGRIVSLRRARGRVRDVCIVPGFVNAHVHLHIAPLAEPVRAFVPWIRAVMGARLGTTRRSEVAATGASIEALLASGTTAVGDIDATGNARQRLQRSPLAGRQYRELTGFHLDAAASRDLVRERLQPATTIATGLSPHAPYSVSAALFRTAAAVCRHLAVHCAEVPEEQQFLRSGKGPFAELLAALGRLPRDFSPPGVGAVRWLERLGVLRANTQLVHCQELERGDVARIAASGASIAVCPGTIEYFDRDVPPVPRWLAAGIPVAFGTDSRASNTALSMPREIQRAARLWPGLRPAQLLQMASLGGARSLGLSHLGRLRRGARADFCVLPARASLAASLAAFVHGESGLLATVCGGRRFRARTAKGAAS